MSDRVDKPKNKPLTRWARRAGSYADRLLSETGDSVHRACLPTALYTMGTP